MIYLLFLLPFDTFAIIEFGQITDEQNWKNDQFWKLDGHPIVENAHDWNFQNPQFLNEIFHHNTPNTFLQQEIQLSEADA